MTAIQRTRTTPRQGPRPGRVVRRAGPLLLLAVGALACQPAPTGIRVELKLGMFRASATTLQLTVTVDGGFEGTPVAARDGLTIHYTASKALVMDFTGTEQHPFADTISFRLDTGNREDLTFGAHLDAFNAASSKIASADEPGLRLPAGREAPLVLELAPDSDGTNIDTTLIDLANTALDATVTAPDNGTAMATVAVCNLDGNGGDLVIGVPTAGPIGTPATGAVYVIFDGTRSIDLAGSNGTAEMHFYGVNSGDRLGASIACLNFDGDKTDDLVVGAPGAYGNGGGAEVGAGRVYVIKGRTSLRGETIDLARHQADIEWIGAGANAGLGEHVLAARMQRDHPAILMAAPGEGTGVVHLMPLTAFTTAAATPRVLGGTSGHVTFSGVTPQAMAVGDIDGDGVADAGSDVMFGDPRYLSPANGATVGTVYAFRDVDPTATTAFAVGGGALGPARTLTGSADKQAFGAALLAVDLSSLGTYLVVGAPGDNAGTGAALVYGHDSGLLTGSPAPAPGTIKWSFNGGAAGDRFGATLAGGKIGVADGAPLYVGAPDAAPGGKSAAGVVQGYKAKTDGAQPALVQRFFGKASGDRLGTAIGVGPIGGADTKIIADLVMLAPGRADGAAATPPGTAYVRLTK